MLQNRGRTTPPQTHALTRDAPLQPSVAAAFCTTIKRWLEQFERLQSCASSGRRGGVGGGPCILGGLHRLICLHTFQSLMILELCSEHGSMPREGGGVCGEKGKPRGRRGRTEHAWKASDAGREDLWEPLIFTLGARLPGCSEVLQPGDWSHPPGSLRPPSPPPLQPWCVITF